MTAESSPDIEMIEEVKGSTQMSNKANMKTSEDNEIIVCNDSPNTYPFSFQGMENESVIGPSTSNVKEKARIIKFTIRYKDQTFFLNIPENKTVTDLKRQIFSVTQVPVCRQILRGWRNPRTDNTPLSSLNLASEENLLLTSIDANMDGHMEVDDDLVNRLNLTYTLNIKDETNNKEHEIKYIGTKPILEIKTDVFTLTNIPTRHQVWSGWPDTVKDDSTLLGCAGINYPAHSLSVKSSENNEEKKKYKRIINLDDSEESSVEEFEDATESFTTDEDDIFITDVKSKKLQPLIPDKVEDETAGCLHFSDEFTSRYGPLHPEFFPGSLEDAIKEACSKPVRERRLLAIYLHHDESILCNVFCTQLLCCESVVHCLTANYVVWGWDLTFEANNLKFLDSVTKNLGALTANQIKKIPQGRLPAIVIVSRVKTSTEITGIIQGNVGVDELMAALTEAVDVFAVQQKMEIREDERTQREMIMIEQDAAFRESLEMDRAKEEARKQQELIENQEKERIELQKKLEEARKEAERLEVESRLPVEPEEGANDVTKIRVRLPKGEFIERRFFSKQPLQVLLDYLIVKGYPSSEYKVISSWPRRDLTSVDTTKTFKELNLYPQETVILEER
ncbi:UNVERIFIED_CONTAM: hypothetical protein PYX00_000768 [Menopon gallinae]